MSLEKPDALTFLKRTPQTDAKDEEAARWTDEFPVLDRGVYFSDRVRAALLDLRRGIDMEKNLRLLREWRNRMVEDVLLGMWAQMNVMVCRMMINEPLLPDGPRYGMPPALNIHCAVRWEDPRYSDPLRSVLAVLRVGREHREHYDRITISTRDFLAFWRSEEVLGFMRYLRHHERSPEHNYDHPDYEPALRNAIANGLTRLSAPMPIPPDLPIPPEMLGFTAMRQVAEQILGVRVEVEDVSYVAGATGGGTRLREKVLPFGLLLFSCTKDDGDPAAMDFYNGKVPARLLKGTGLSEQVGPVAYVAEQRREETEEGAEPDEIILRALRCGGPRKHRATATAVLRV